MAANPFSKVVEFLHDVAGWQEAASLSDRQLVDRFVTRRDDMAFTVLVRRHSALVWGVCRRILNNHHDAEDAFQATFLVLARRAATIGWRDLLANWLYGVAYRTALKARSRKQKQQMRENQVLSLSDPPSKNSESDRELLERLDQELSRLPDKYRRAIVICDLEGRTRKEAAILLRLPEGTVASHLTRGRAAIGQASRKAWQSACNSYARFGGFSTSIDDLCTRRGNLEDH